MASATEELLNVFILTVNVIAVAHKCREWTDCSPVKVDTSLLVE